MFRNFFPSPRALGELLLNWADRDHDMWYMPVSIDTEVPRPVLLLKTEHHLDLQVSAAFPVEDKQEEAEELGMTSPRRSNSAKPEELLTTLRLHLPGGLDKKYLGADPGNVVKSYENLLIDLLCKTCRPTETLLQQACLKAFQSVKKEEAGIWARAVSDACS